MLDKLGLRQTPNGSATNEDEAVAIARTNRLSRARAAVVRARRTRDGARLHGSDLRRYMRERGRSQPGSPGAGRSLSRRRDRSRRRLHRRRRDAPSSARSWSTSNRPGIHSGDSAWSCRRSRFRETVIDEIRERTKAMARELKVIGLMNVQFAVKGDKVYVLEVNPRASRTVPFVSKAIGVPLAKLAAKVMAGKTLRNSASPRKSCRNITR